MKKPFLVTPPGFEPRLAEPKSDVLPLHHEAMLKSECKYRFFFYTAKNQVVNSINFCNKVSISSKVLCLLKEKRTGTHVRCG